MDSFPGVMYKAIQAPIIIKAKQQISPFGFFDCSNQRFLFRFSRADDKRRRQHPRFLGKGIALF